MTDELYIPAPVKKDTRMIGIGLAVAAAALLLFASFSRAWVARPLGAFDIGFGPMGCKNCNMLTMSGDDAPSNMSNGAFIDMVRTADPSAERETSSVFAPMGWVTFGTCVVAGLALLAAAFLAFRKQRPELPISPASLALLMIMIGLIAGCVFVAKKPGGPGFVGVAIGFWCFGVGCVLGIAGAQMLAKEIRPIDPDLLEGSMNPEQY